MDICDKPIKIADRKSGINQENRKYLDEIPKLKEKIINRGVCIEDLDYIIFLDPSHGYEEILKKYLDKELQGAQIIKWIDFRTV